MQRAYNVLLFQSIANILLWQENANGKWVVIVPVHERFYYEKQTNIVVSALTNAGH